MASEDHESRLTHQQQQQRPRADTCDTMNTEPSMSEADKLHLLNSAFDGVDNSGDVTVPRSASVAANQSMSDSGDEGGEKDYLGMFEEGGGPRDGKKSDVAGGKKGEEPPKKRRKTGKDEAVSAGNDRGGDSSDGSSSDDESDVKSKTQKRPHVQLTQKQQEQLDLAKNKLSKWAARLFDPNRRRGLVEAPTV